MALKSQPTGIQCFEILHTYICLKQHSRHCTVSHDLLAATATPQETWLSGVC